MTIWNFHTNSDSDNLGVLTKKTTSFLRNPVFLGVLTKKAMFFSQRTRPLGPGDIFYFFNQVLQGEDTPSLG